jgi:microsomal dipeptidase-like Zn-dependent dipeptidase
VARLAREQIGNSLAAISRRLALVFGGLSAVVVSILFALPTLLDWRMNHVIDSPPYFASDRARAILKRATVVDLHADSLLWARDLAARSRRGQVDIPRLIEANVALQAFTIVTKSPRNLNFERNSADTDNITALAIVERWPARTWTSLTERALYQAAKLQEVERRSNGKFTIVRSADDLRRYLDRRRADPEQTAGFLGIEGAHALDGKIENLDRLCDAGIRMMSPSHFFDNEIGGSAAGVEKTGLRAMGREMIRRMEAKHMLVDIAHAAPKTIDDVLAMATRPVIVSHTGVKGTCDNMRNLSDEQLRGVARTGGLIGIAYFQQAVCGTDPASIARAMRYASQIAGVDHIALGSDFDGSVETAFDTTGLPLLVDAMLAAGFRESEVEQILGGNAVRVLLATLP